MATRAEDVVSNPEFSEFFRCMCDIRYLHLKLVTSYEGKQSEETSTNLQRKNDSMESVKFPIRTGNYSQWAFQNWVTFSSRTQIGWNDYDEDGTKIKKCREIDSGNFDLFFIYRMKVSTI